MTVVVLLMSLKKLFTRYMPSPEQLRSHKHLKVFGHFLEHHNLWYLNRRSAAGAVAIGLFMAWVPVPFQMFLAAGAAVIARVNVPISVALVWLTNPVTMPPMFYGAYRLGAWILDSPRRPFNFTLSWEWLMDSLYTIGPSFLTGCFIIGVLSSLLGYFLVNILWRLSIMRQRRARLGSAGNQLT